jgi:hypothetical protein
MLLNNKKAFSVRRRRGPAFAINQQLHRISKTQKFKNRVGLNGTVLFGVRRCS